jgi:virulence-associated protein VagC
MVYISLYHKHLEVIAMESVAKLFNNGRSQAVRLPKEFRFKGNEVRIRKQGDKVILEPMKNSEWPDGFWDIFTIDPRFETPEPLPSTEFDLD